MTVQISQRGKECLKTAQTLLRTARTMTDEAIAAQLKDLAERALPGLSTGFDLRQCLASVVCQVWLTDRKVI